jgi:hypothetical protein
MSCSFKVLPRTGTCPEKKSKYSSTLSLTSVIDEVSGQRHARPLYSGKSPVPIVRETEWAPESVWTSVENFAPTGIRSPDRAPRSESIYRLSYLLINSSCFNFSYISYFSLQITNFQKAFTTTIPFSIIFLSCNFYFNIIRSKQDRDFSDQSTVQVNRKKESLPPNV